jgi:hypothetical protein
MPTIDPKWRFIIGLVVTFAIYVTQGTIVLTNAIPQEFIKPVVAWCGIIAAMGSTITTVISAVGMSNSNRIASAAVIPEVQKIVTTEAIANATPSDKVVAK